MGAYATHAGKTYLKAVIVGQANAALQRGQQVTPPPGVVFEAFTEPHLFVVLKKLKFEGRFLVEREDGADKPLHAFPYAVKRIDSVPDDCPPFTAWVVTD
jgi:hypothetical protein